MSPIDATIIVSAVTALGAVCVGAIGGFLGRGDKMGERLMQRLHRLEDRSETQEKEILRLREDNLEIRSITVALTEWSARAWAILSRMVPTPIEPPPGHTQEAPTVDGKGQDWTDKPLKTG